MKDLVLNHKYDDKCNVAKEVVETIENHAQSSSDVDEKAPYDLEFTIKNFFSDDIKI